jgi:hypothetical protein
MILRQRFLTIRILVILIIAYVGIWALPSPSRFSVSPSSQYLVSTRRAIQFQLSPSSDESQCPFIKFFPRYRIELVRRGKTKYDTSAWFSLAPLKGLSESLSKRRIQRQVRTSERLIWAADEDGIAAFARLWMEANGLLQVPEESSVVVALPDATPTLIQNWVKILSWMTANYPWGVGSLKLDASILDGETATSVRIEKQGIGSATLESLSVDPEIINQRTKSWVKRILVEQGICPFTKSVKMSGQGLTDVGVPVASIAYHASAAIHPVTLFADTFQAIRQMIEAGPSGKTGVSSILLAAPNFDEDFDLWSGQIFAMLEASVVAALAESQIGVVCFHPRYACPDGSSWPGFGQMHSVTRLEKWYLEAKSSDETADCPVLSTEDVAAGGEFMYSRGDGSLCIGPRLTL